MSVAPGRPGTAGLLMVRDGEGMYILLVKYRRYLANHLVKNTVRLSSGCAITRWRRRLARRFDPSKAGRHSTFNLEICTAHSASALARPARVPARVHWAVVPWRMGQGRDVMSGMTGHLEGPRAALACASGSSHRRHRGRSSIPSANIQRHRQLHLQPFAP